MDPNTSRLPPLGVGRVTGARRVAPVLEFELSPVLRAREGRMGRASTEPKQLGISGAFTSPGIAKPVGELSERGNSL